MTIHRTWHTLININNVRISTHCLGLFNFLHDCYELQKASGITPWKKCYSLLRWPCLLQDVLNKTVLFSKPAAVAPKETSPIISSFLNWANEKTVDAAKICGGAENVVKTETQQTFVNGLLGFITLKHLYSAGSACIAPAIIAWVAHRYGQLYLHCSLIYFWVPSSCFCIVISLSLRVK